MKTRHIIIAAVALLAFPPATQAQKKIKEAFADIVTLSGVSKTSEQKTSRKIDNTGLVSESSIVTLKVTGRDHYLAVICKLKEAFRKEGKNASMTEIETGGEVHDVDSFRVGDLGSVLVHDLGLRKQWNIWREGSEPVFVGTMKNSCYLIANFDDKQHPDFRTCYAAEWSRTGAPDVYTTQLTYVYGRKPESQADAKVPQYKGLASWSLQLPALTKSLEKLRNLPDSLLTQPFDPARLKMYGLGTAPKDIPYQGSKDEWMSQAMNQVKYLSASDWHRFFGLLTEKMMTRANDKSTEDLVVTAGIILDLCKNADQLDADERQVSARRLTDIAQHHFDSDKHQYIYDLLMLGAKKLEKQ